MNIHVLSDELISQIAAGEVVERPASVVKELIENALDAGAGVITIRIEESGLRLIEVADDGDGIGIDQIELALHRHATSKLQQASDLFRIQTLGFRGEALASMASVSRLTMTSRRKGSAVGGQMMVDGGRASGVINVGVPEGTVVCVENLFFNVPARLAFLKKPVTEKGRINSLVYRYALAYPEVRWQLEQDHKPVLRTSGNGDQREILAAMYSVAISKDMIEVNLIDGDIHIYGFISPIEITRSYRREMTFFLNGRWIQDAGLSSALFSAYQNLLPPRRYPIAAIFIEMDPEQVDVNVHPAKAEVRFRDQNRIFTTVQRAVRRAFMAFTPINPGGNQSWNSTSTGMQSAHSENWRSDHSHREVDPAWTLAGMMRNEKELPGGDENKTDEDSENRQSPLISGETSLFRLIGAFKGRYLLVEAPDGLYLVDEKAAMERVVYETFLRQVSESQLNTVEMEERTTINVEENIDGWMAAFEKLGFLLENFGPKSYRILGIPEFYIQYSSISEVIQAVMGSIAGKKFETIEEKCEWLLREIVHMTGEYYSTDGDRDKQEWLLARLQVCQSPRYCPDGRTILIHLSLDLLNRQFNRG
ncbi:MAG: DNA mismatch repair endonuclease MutL [Anaerolineaceae bacterium]|nr:DNA mismatch repair endonuclease MutL [Anaerolineaceae bacterium]